MTSAELYRLIELPEEMKELFTRWDGELTPQADEELTERLLDRTRWDGAVQELYERVGEDPDHLKVLWEELRIGAAQWPKWQAKGIPEEIYRDTMAFGTRYLYDGKKAYGRWCFTAGWWFQRHLAMELFRLGSLEYELMNLPEGRRAYIHIPTDADLSPAALDDSLRRFRDFAAAFYPEWAKAEIWCDSWLMSPAIRPLLPEHSRIIGFQDRFDLVSVDAENMGGVEWVFPGMKDVPREDLPEDTALRRNMKAFLLAGGRPGWAARRLREG